jgi:isoquinoline 1-oxidoreductase/isoquinoline 1-oxidoreductase beta subunit
VLTPSEQFQFIGKYEQRLDNAIKVDGSAEFGLDVDVPESLTAVLVRCPHFGGALKRFDASQALTVSGVNAIFALEGQPAIAVVADGYWAARKAADILTVEWDMGPLAAVSSQSIAQRQQQLLDSDEGYTVRDDGDYDGGAVVAQISADYSVPHLSHTPMEPPTATVAVTDDRVDIWSSVQGPEMPRGAVANALGRPVEEVFVHCCYIGGGFGRKAISDFVVEAALIAEQVAKPVKLIWSREDDLRHDHYRPAARCRFVAEFDERGAVHRWQHRIVGESILQDFIPYIADAALPAWLPKSLPKKVGGWLAEGDAQTVEGAAELPYDFNAITVENVEYDSGVPVSFWRSVGHSYNAFFVESFIDEVAHKIKADTYQYRQKHLQHHPRHLAVLKRVAQLAGWGSHLATGHFHGIAIHQSFGTVVAQVAEVSVSNNQIRVHRVYCVVDCGQVINPDIVKMQMESGIIFGLTAALYGEITIKEGAVVESNFDDYPMLRINETPTIRVEIITSQQPPTGVGEPGLPPIAPAVANAVFAATGQRLRSLPLRIT